MLYRCHAGSGPTTILSSSRKQQIDAGQRCTPPVLARSGVDLLLNVILCCGFSQMLNGRERVILLCVCLCLLVHIHAVVSDRSDAAAQNDNDKVRKPRAHLPVRKHYSCLCLWRKTFCVGRNFNLAVCFFFSVCFVRLLCCCA